MAGALTPASPLPLYWDTLTAFDSWRGTLSGPLDHSEGVLKYVPRKLIQDDIVGKGKLLVFAPYRYRIAPAQLLPGFS